jgi:hypothetical protein
LNRDHYVQELKRLGVTPCQPKLPSPSNSMNNPPPSSTPARVVKPPSTPSTTPSARVAFHSPAMASSRVCPYVRKVLSSPDNYGECG